MTRRFALSFAVLFVLCTTSAATQEVRLPLEDYEELRRRADPPPDPSPEPVVPVAFERAFLTLEVGEESARLTQELTLVLDADAWKTLELPSDGTFLGADFGDLEGFVETGEAEDEGRLRLRGSGRHRVTLESAVPVECDETATRSTCVFDIDLPAAAAVSGRLLTSEDVEEVQVVGTALVSGPEPRGQWRWVGKPGSSVRLTLLGAARSPAKEDLPLRFDAQTGTAVRLSRTRTRADAWIGLRVLEGRLESLTTSLPEGWDVVRVESRPKASWDVVDGRLALTPVEPVENVMDVRVELTRGPVESIRAPLLAPEGADRLERYTRVHVAGDGLLELEDAGGGRRAHEGSSRMAPALAQGPGALFRVDGGAAPLWNVVWSERAQVLAAEVPRMLVHVLVGQGRAFYQVWLETRNTGATSLDLELPEGFATVVAARDGSRVTPGLQGRSLVLPLTVTRQGQVVFLSGFVPLGLPPGDGKCEIPLPSLSVPVREVEVRAWLPGQRRYELVDPTRRGSVGPPPTVESSAVRSVLLDNLAQLRSARPAGFGAPEDSLDAPLGFEVVDAAWVALAPSPSPLALEVSDPQSLKEWF